MHVNAWSFGQPLVHGQMLLGGVVVGDQVQLLGRQRLPFDLRQELQPFEVSMALFAPGDNLAIEYVQCREQRGGTLALVLVILSHRRSAALLQRQAQLTPQAA